MDWFILAFISALFSAASVVSEKKVLFSLNALDFSFITSLITLIFTIPFFLYVDFSSIRFYGMEILFIKTILNAMAFLCVMLSMKNMEISEALPLLALSPAFVAIAGILLINDSLNSTEWIGILLMVAGTYILELRDTRKNIFAPFKSLLDLSKYKYVFFAILLFTVTSILDRLLLTKYKMEPYTFMSFQQLFYTLFFLVMVLVKKREVVKTFVQAKKNLLFLILAISFFTIIYRYTQIEATQIAPAALVLSVKRVSILIVVITGGRFFKEEGILRKTISAVIILAGLFLLNYK